MRELRDRTRPWMGKDIFVRMRERMMEIVVEMVCDLSGLGRRQPCL